MQDIDGVTRSKDFPRTSDLFGPFLLDRWWQPSFSGVHCLHAKCLEVLCAATTTWGLRLAAIHAEDTVKPRRWSTEIAGGILSAHLAIIVRRVIASSKPRKPGEQLHNRFIPVLHQFLLRFVIVPRIDGAIILSEQLINVFEFEACSRLARGYHKAKLSVPLVSGKKK